MRKRSWSPSRRRGPGDADFAGGICRQSPTAAIYSLGAGGGEGRVRSSSSPFPLPATTPGTTQRWNHFPRRRSCRRKPEHERIPLAHPSAPSPPWLVGRPRSAGSGPADAAALTKSGVSPARGSFHSRREVITQKPASTWAHVSKGKCSTGGDDGSGQALETLQ